MAKRKKRNAVTLVSLLLALAALIVVYVLYDTKEPATEDTNKDTGTINLATMDTKLINSLHYAGKDADITLELKDDNWVSSTEPDRPINQNYVKNMVNLTDNVTATRVVNENPEDLSEYGLDKPAATLEAAQSDGKTFKILIGDKVSTGDGYYAMVNSDKKVYLVGITFGEGLQYSNTDMNAVEAVPDMTAESIHHLSIDNRDSADLDLLLDKANIYDLTNSSLFPWLMKQPYGEGYTADSSLVTKLLSNYISYDFVSNVDYKGTDLAKYGLDNPMSTLTVEYYEASSTDTASGTDSTDSTNATSKSFKLFIGNQDEDGNYYVKKEGSNSIYTMRSTDIDKLLQVNAFDNLNKYVLIPNIETVNKADITIDGKKYTMEIKRTAAKDTDSKDETQATYYYNGKEVKAETFKGVYQEMVTAKIDAESKTEIKTDGLTPYMTITYYMSGNRQASTTASFYPNNDSFYSIDTGHGVKFLADRRRIDEIAKAIVDFKPKEE